MPAPNLICVTQQSGDMLLEWELPPPCSGVISEFEIYSSDDLNGPYTLLTTITNTNQTQYTDINVGGNIKYYYMQSVGTCGTPLTSDTLDTLLPIAPQLETVSVDGNVVEITWTTSPSPETYAYILEWQQANGFSPADTLLGQNTNFYIHNNANPTQGQEAYLIRAIDQCGNESLISNTIHRTIFLSATQDACRRTVDLSWLPYEGFTIEHQELWLSVNGASEMLADTLSANATQFSFPVNSDLEEYCFRIKVVEAGTLREVWSNQICETLDIISPMDFIYFKNITINPNNEAEIFWKWDDDAEISAAQIQLNSTETFDLNPALPLNENEFYTNNINATGEPMSFQIATTDLCGDEVISDIGRSIFLSGQSGEEGINLLSWTPFDLPFGTLNQYALYKILPNGSEELLGVFEAGETSFTEAVNFGNPAEANARYYIMAIGTLEFPDGTSCPVESRSNTIRIEQQVRMVCPNAIAPEGANRIFKPVLFFGETASYNLVVFNRWGENIFESNDPELGWDGTRDGRILPKGMYPYLIRLQQPGFEVVQKKGMVMLVR